LPAPRRDIGSELPVGARPQEFLTSILKPGFSPVEQYDGEVSMLQGPWNASVAPSESNSAGAWAEVTLGGRQNTLLDSCVLVESLFESLEPWLDRHRSVDLWLASRRVDC
jgi:hypothetical protein